MLLLVFFHKIQLAKVQEEAKVAEDQIPPPLLPAELLVNRQLVKVEGVAEWRWTPPPPLPAELLVNRELVKLKGE